MSKYRELNNFKLQGYGVPLIIHILEEENTYNSVFPLHVITAEYIDDQNISHTTNPIQISIQDIYEFQEECIETCIPGEQEIDLNSLKKYHETLDETSAMYDLYSFRIINEMDLVDELHDILSKSKHDTSNGENDNALLILSDEDNLYLLRVPIDSNIEAVKSIQTTVFDIVSSQLILEPTI